MDFLLLSLVILAATAVWPVYRRLVRTGARPEVVGTCASLVAVLSGLTVSVVTHQSLWEPTTVLLGGVSGVVYAMACIVILYCLRTGPIGPTTTINNMGMLWPVAISITVLEAGTPLSKTTWAGFVAAVAALILIGWSDRGSKGSVTRRWVVMAFAAWIISGVFLTCQLLMSRYSPGCTYAYVVSAYGVSMICLAVISVAKGYRKPTRMEMLGGLAAGLTEAVQVPLKILLLSRIPAAVVMPITVAGPIVLVLIAGHFVYRDKLRATGWLACTLGIIGITLLSLSHG